MNSRLIDYKIDSMKYIVRIIGILMIGVLLLFTYVFTTENGDLNWRTCIVFICLLIGWLYSIGTKFGFHEPNKGINIFYKITCICVLLSSIGGFGNLIVQDYRSNQEEEKRRVKDSIESAELLEVIDWGKDTTVFFIECQLKTRFKKKWGNSGEMEYIFKSTFLREGVSIEKYIVTLRDKNTFKIGGFEITSKTSLWDPKNKRIGGAYADGEIKLSKEIYKAIDHFDVSIKENS